MLVKAIDGSFKQAIGCFASSGATATVVLEKLILQAVVHLENCGEFFLTTKQYDSIQIQHRMKRHVSSHSRVESSCNFM